MRDVRCLGVVGTGVIGSGWAAHFLARGDDLLPRLVVAVEFDRVEHRQFVGSAIAAHRLEANRAFRATLMRRSQIGDIAHDASHPFSYGANLCIRLICVNAARQHSC